jgi:hypothetical protein
MVVAIMLDYVSLRTDTCASVLAVGCRLPIPNPGVIFERASGTAANALGSKGSVLRKPSEHSSILAPCGEASL